VARNLAFPFSQAFVHITFVNFSHKKETHKKERNGWRKHKGDLFHQSFSIDVGCRIVLSLFQRFCENPTTTNSTRKIQHCKQASKHKF